MLLGQQLPVKWVVGVAPMSWARSAIIRFNSTNRPTVLRLNMTNGKAMGNRLPVWRNAECFRQPAAAIESLLAVLDRLSLLLSLDVERYDAV